MQILDFTKHINLLKKPRITSKFWINKLISNSTNSIIEKTCIEDLNRKGSKEVSTSETWKEDSSEPSKGNLSPGNTQRKYIHDTLD